MKNFTCLHEYLKNKCYIKKRQLLILITFCMSAIGYAQTFTENNILYSVISSTANTVRTIDYNTAGGSVVVIPTNVIDASTNITYTVIEIGSSSFSDNNLTSVTIPTSVTIIGNGAFSNNPNLISAPLHNGITSIGYAAFQVCALTNVNIPTSMTTIEDSAFLSNNINNVIIPNNVTSIGINAFNNNPNLVSAQLHNGITSIGIGAFNSCALTSVNIPTGMTTIENFTFAFNDITNISIPNTITSIGNSAFSVNEITNLVLPTSVTSIGSQAFHSNQLSCVTSEATVPPAIVNNSFGDRSNINLSIPSGTASVYASATWTGFNSVSEGLTGIFTIDNMTYQINSTPNNEVTVTGYNIAGGTNVVIPSNVSSGCIEYSVTDIGNAVFANFGLTNLTLPNTLVSIGIQSFGLNALTSVIIPASVTTIGSGAFAVNNLTDVYSESMVPPTITTSNSISTDSFGNRSNTHLHIPAGTMGAYVTDAGALWTGFNPVTEDALSVDDFELEDSIKVITNTDEIEIVFPSSVIFKNHGLYTITGAKVKAGTGTVVPISFLAKGIYILKLNFDRGSISKKLVIH